MRALFICAFVSTACSTTIEAKRPLTAEKIDELRSATRSRRVKVESATGGGAPLGLLVGPFLGAGLGTAIGAGLPHSCGPNCNDSEKQALNMIGGVAVGT